MPHPLSSCKWVVPHPGNIYSNGPNVSQKLYIACVNCMSHVDSKYKLICFEMLERGMRPIIAMLFWWKQSLYYYHYNVHVCMSFLAIDNYFLSLCTRNAHRFVKLTAKFLICVTFQSISINSTNSIKSIHSFHSSTLWDTTIITYFTM